MQLRLRRLRRSGVSWGGGLRSLLVAAAQAASLTTKLQLQAGPGEFPDTPEETGELLVERPVLPLHFEEGGWRDGQYQVVAQR